MQLLKRYSLVLFQLRKNANIVHVSSTNVVFANIMSCFLGAIE